MASTALVGSIAGAGGTRVWPAPIRPLVRRSALVCRVGRPPNEVALAEPSAVEPRWIEVRVAVEPGDDGVAAAGAGGTSGEPHTSQ